MSLNKPNDIRIRHLIERIEKMAGFHPCHPKEFDRLRTIIYNRTGELLSSTTLKRLWGYLDEPLNTRESTLTILANSLGYSDWKACCHRLDNPEEDDPSSPILGKCLNVINHLKPGDTLTLTWNPERRCLVRYEGDGKFKVVESEKTRLRPDDTFFCHIIIPGYPLYLSELRQGSNPPIGYVCGRGEGGIQFHLD